MRRTLAVLLWPAVLLRASFAGFVEDDPAIELARRTCSGFRKDHSAPRVLVTGGAGFVGSHLIPRLRQAHPTASIKVVDNPWRGQLSNLLSEYGQQLVDFEEDLCVEARDFRTLPNEGVQRATAAP